MYSDTQNFYDAKQILRSPGENFYDYKGILRSPGENFYDYKGILRSPHESFYDKQGILRSSNASFYDGNNILRGIGCGGGQNTSIGDAIFFGLLSMAVWGPLTSGLTNTFLWTVILASLTAFFLWWVFENKKYKLFFAILGGIFLLWFLYEGATHNKRAPVVVNDQQGRVTSQNVKNLYELQTLQSNYERMQFYKENLKRTQANITSCQEQYSLEKYGDVCGAEMLADAKKKLKSKVDDYNQLAAQLDSHSLGNLPTRIDENGNPVQQ